MVDAWDLKSLGRKAVPVRVRPRVSSSITKFYKVLSSVQRANLGQAAPDPQMAVGDRELGRAHPAPLQIAQHRGPTLRRLPLAALYGEHRLLPIGIGADQHEQRRLARVEPGLHVHLS